MNEPDPSLVNERIRDHYESPYHCGPADAFTHASEGSIAVCGDRLRVELAIGPDDVIEEAWFQADACVLSQAAASMLMETVEHMSVEDAKQWDANQMLDLIGQPLIAKRQKCALLAWRVLQDALDSPIDLDADGDAHFGGPSLREES